MSKEEDLKTLITVLQKIDSAIGGKAQDSFNESAHKRSSNGQFGSGSGSGTKATPKASGSKGSSGAQMTSSSGHSITINEKGGVYVKNQQGVMVNPANLVHGSAHNGAAAKKAAFIAAAKEGPAALQKLTGQSWKN